MLMDISTVAGKHLHKHYVFVSCVLVVSFPSFILGRGKLHIIVFLLVLDYIGRVPLPRVRTTNSILLVVW